MIGRAEGKIKVHLDIDPEQKPEEAYWYPYSPVTANVMYSVPELGARVLLTIMDEKESNAVVSCCIRKASQVLPQTEVKMMWSGFETYVAAPDYMGFCYEGAGNTEAVVLDDEIGFIINTGKGLKLRAEGRIFLQGGGVVSLSGIKETNISHPNAIGEQSWISMDCGRIRLGGSPIVYSGGLVNEEADQGSPFAAIDLGRAVSNVLAAIPVATSREAYEGVNTAIYASIESGSIQSFGEVSGTVSTMEETKDSKGEKGKKPISILQEV